MKKLCLAALAAVSLLGCSDTKEEEKTAEKATEKAAEGHPGGQQAGHPR